MRLAHASNIRSDATVYPRAPETCDGADNDCDGIVDEGVSSICGVSAEYCMPGVDVCAHDVGVDPVVMCIGAIIFAPETCDGIDNDCNGMVDDGCT